MKRPTKRVTQLACAAVIVGLSCAGPAFVVPAAATPVSGAVDAVGWWSSRATAMAQPEGGFEVASAPDGAAQSVAAVNIRVDIATMKTLQITLTESTSVGSQLAHIRACAAAPGWSPANPGAFDQAPSMDCGVAVDLAHTSAGTWVGNIATLVPNGGTASIGFVPVADSPAPVGTGLLVDITGVNIAGQGDVVERTVTPEPGSDPDPALNSYDPSASGFNDTPIINLDPGTITNPGNAFELPDSTATTVPAFAAQKDLTSTLKAKSGPTRPWIRLVWLTPLSAAIGVGVVFGRRFLVNQGVSFQ
jgi:hypothetical protein